MPHPVLFRFDTLPARALFVQTGANEGDTIGLEEAVVPGDVYRLAARERIARLAISDTGREQPCVADGSEVGHPGDVLTIAACHLLMAPAGDLVEVLVLVLTDADGSSALHLLPLSRLLPNVEYELVGTETEDAPQRFADIASVSFLAGTHLTLANGRQIPVEDLRIGDRLLTRDNGPRPIRWIAHQTRRATGAAAPIRLIAGTLNTARDLRLSPQHRLFIWQRRDELGTGRADLMVKADLLVNGTTVLREEGGFVDSYQIVFDSHEIIYAEGIAVESMLVTGQMRALLPKDLGLSNDPDAQADAAEIEIDETKTGSDDIVDRLTRASRGDPARD
ncbi:hypothetical protein roselon_00157 [Roseibacterium elongatum DSM 19469]|uniref:Hint domain-containing protein n=1 Tax=Roseicyclus elongatus DSM 19469 TaxID=1294273 RepID=W8RNA2_9RHOB|nr:Hint domain-containing protein [Roseibacterium elongatum]AHM02614.1 hypothetical protein roselon_00157 [Roseibacterium elongatum DSM 19469]